MNAERLLRPGGPRVIAALAVAVTALSLVGGAGRAAAQAEPPPDTAPPVSSPVSTTAPTSTPSPTPDVPPGPDAPPATDPVTGLPLDPLAPTTTVDPLATSADGGGAYAGQGLFDPASTAVLGSEVSRSRSELAAARSRLAEAQSAVDGSVAELARLATRIDDVGRDREAQLAGAVRAKAELRRRAVDAFIRGRDAELVVITSDPETHSRASRYLQTVADLDREAVEDYDERAAELSEEELALVDDQAEVERRVASLVAERESAARAVLDADRCLAAFQAGSHFCVPGFVFPVLGDVSFGPGWGAPRMMGTADQHWHEGTDIMAPTGRELVAVEAGTLFKVGGGGGLGGLRLWLRGDSGAEYYYAHVSGFPPGIADGVVVAAGDVIAYNGDTGNAAGGAAHLHFEIHPGGGGPVDPYPLLRAAWGRRPVLPQSQVMAGAASMRAVLPDEER